MEPRAGRRKETTGTRRRKRNRPEPEANCEAAGAEATVGGTDGERRGTCDPGRGAGHDLRPFGSGGLGGETEGRAQSLGDLRARLRRPGKTCGTQPTATQARPAGRRPCALPSVAAAVCDVPGRPGDAMSGVGTKGIRPHVTAAQGSELRFPGPEPRALLVVTQFPVCHVRVRSCGLFVPFSEKQEIPSS